LVEQAASGDSGCSDVREKEEITSTTIVRKEVSIVVAVGLVPILIDRSRGDLAVPPEIVKNGQFDRDAAADALRKFLEETVRAGKFQLTVTVRVLGAAVDGGTTTAREEEVIADLDGRDKEFLLERGAEALKALEHLAYRALRLEPAFHEKIHLDCGGYRALRFEELRMTARVAAERVQASKQPFRLNPMSSRERRIVHMALKEMPGVRTESVGVGEERQVVIHPAAAAGTEGAAGRT
jgi:spoIIIJ-associated protein